MNAPSDRVLAWLPQREPFRFVSEIHELEPGRTARGAWRVNAKEAFLRGHFPQAPIVPGVLITEALGQLAGIVAFGPVSQAPPAPAMLAHIDIRFRRRVIPPATIVLHAALVRHLDRLWLFEVSAKEGDVEVARGRLALAAGTGENASS
jgi:3-hydroxyacyl-[acyl-carrier-protein] dehydratase